MNCPHASRVILGCRYFDLAIFLKIALVSCNGDDDVIAIVQRMAADRVGLLSLKRGLRARLQALPAWNVVAHTRAMEEAFFKMAADPH